MSEFEQISPILAKVSCRYCESERDFLEKMCRDLAIRYSSSQNYYFTRDINDILSDKRTFPTIKFKDLQCLDEVDEYLKRGYKVEEYPDKMVMLTEYYKFHKDIPRLFMQPVVNSLNKYHDRKRRHDYVKITKMLKNEGDEMDKTPKIREPMNNRILDQLTPYKKDENRSSMDTLHELKAKLAEAISNSKYLESEISESMANSRILQFLVNENMDKPIYPAEIFKKKEIAKKKPVSSIKMLNLEKLKVKKPSSSVKKSSIKSAKPQDSIKGSLRRSNNISRNDKSGSDSRLQRNLASRKALEKKRSEGSKLKGPASAHAKSELIKKKSFDKVDLDSLRVQTDRNPLISQEKKRDWRKLLRKTPQNNEKLLKSDIVGNSLKEKLFKEAKKIRPVDSREFKTKNRKKPNLKVGPSKTDRLVIDSIPGTTLSNHSKPKLKTTRDSSKHMYTKSESQFLQVNQWKEHERFLEDIRKAVLPFVKKGKGREQPRPSFNNNFFNFFVQEKPKQSASVKSIRQHDFFLENFLKERKKLFN